MPQTYYILQNEEQNGPFTFDEIIETGPDVHTRILSPLAGTWEDACDLAEFSSYFRIKHFYFPTEANLATFGWRLLAYLVDFVILVVAMVAVINIFADNGVKFNIDNYTDVIKLQLIFFGALLFYNAISEASPLMGSPGKKACGMVVVDIDGRRINFLNALVRSAGKAMSIFLMYTGFFSILFSEYKQALHDFLAKTYVVRKGI